MFSKPNTITPQKYNNSENYVGYVSIKISLDEFNKKPFFRHKTKEGLNVSTPQK